MAVAEQTVAALAKQLKITVSRLLSLLKEAGIAVENEEDTLTPAQKVALTKHMAAKKGGEKKLSLKTPAGFSGCFAGGSTLILAMPPILSTTRPYSGLPNTA